MNTINRDEVNFLYEFASIIEKYNVNIGSYSDEIVFYMKNGDNIKEFFVIPYDKGSEYIREYLKKIMLNDR